MKSIDLLNIGIYSSSTFGNYESEYIEVLERAVTRGFVLPSVNVQVIQNEVIKQLKDSGIYVKLDVLFLFTGSNVDFAMINMIKPTHEALSQPGAVGYSYTQGIITDTLNSLDVNELLNNSINYAVGNQSMFCWKASSTVSFFTGLKGVTLDSKNFIRDNRGILSCNTEVFYSASTTNGLVHLDRYSGLYKGIMNGVEYESISLTGGDPLPALPIYLGAYNNNGGITSRNNTEIPVFGYGASLAEDKTILYNIINNYNTAIGTITV